jgi:hypothetical protein
MPICIGDAQGPTRELLILPRASQAAKAAGKAADLIVLNGYNHFEVAESLGNPYGLLGRAVLRQMQLSSI